MTTQTVNVVVATSAGDVEVRAEVDGSEISFAQLDAGCWHFAGSGKLRHTDGAASIEDCAARFGLQGVDATEEIYSLLEGLLSKIQWHAREVGSNVKVVDGEQVFFATVPSTWTEDQAAEEFMRDYEILPEVVEEYGSEAAALAEVRRGLAVTKL